MRKMSVLLMFLLLSGCASYDATFQPPIGYLYTNVKAPLKLNLKDADVSTKEGEAKTLTFQWGIWGFSEGDTSIKTAMNSALIKEAAYADYEYTNVLFGLYQSLTVYAYGKK